MGVVSLSVSTERPATRRFFRFDSGFVHAGACASPLYKRRCTPPPRFDISIPSAATHPQIQEKKIQPRFDLLAAAAAAMDRGKQPAASPPPLQQQRTAYPASFEAYFSAMGLGGASSSGQEPQTPRQAQLQQRYATPNSPLMLPQPPPSQGGGGGGQGGVHPLMQQHQMMLAQMRATQLQQQQQTSSYCVGEQGSSTNGYFWPVGHGGVSPAEAAAHAQGSSDYAMLLAADRPMPLAADRILPSAADGSSSDYLSRFANGYANNAAAAAPAAPRRPWRRGRAH